MEIIFNSFDPKTITNIVHDRFLDAENIIWDKEKEIFISIAHFEHNKIQEGANCLADGL